MAKDPDLSHIKRKDYNDVYEPCEDSFLFMDAITKDAEFLQARFPQPPLCLEVGCGTGIVTAHLGRTLGRGYFLATDKNPRAAELAHQTFLRNGVCGDTVNTDLVSGLAERLRGRVDILLFNPPYVPTPPEEMEGCGLSIAWAGGEKGREVLDRLLPSIPALLSPSGVFYLVVLPANEPEEISALLARTAGLSVSTAAYRKAHNEHLSILRFDRPLSASGSGSSGPTEGTAGEAA